MGIRWIFHHNVFFVERRKTKKNIFLVTYVLVNLFIPGHHWIKVIDQTYYSPMVTN